MMVGIAADDEGQGMVVAGIVKHAPGSGRGGGETILGIHPQCSAHSGSSPSPCVQAREL